jgi:hypothetical protein
LKGNQLGDECKKQPARFGRLFLHQTVKPGVDQVPQDQFDGNSGELLAFDRFTHFASSVLTSAHRPAVGQLGRG